MFKERLRELRNKKGLSQTKMGELLKITRQAYCHYENGKREPTQEVLKEISKILNCSIDYLLGNTNDPRPVDKQLAEINSAIYSDENKDSDNSVVIFNRNGEVIRKKFSEEQMKYLEKFISSLADEDYPDL